MNVTLKCVSLLKRPTEKKLPVTHVEETVERKVPSAVWAPVCVCVCVNAHFSLHLGICACTSGCASTCARRCGCLCVCARPQPHIVSICASRSYKLCETQPNVLLVTTMKRKGCAPCYSFTGPLRGDTELWPPSTESPVFTRSATSGTMRRFLSTRCKFTFSPVMYLKLLLADTVPLLPSSTHLTYWPLSCTASEWRSGYKTWLWPKRTVNASDASGVRSQKLNQSNTTMTWFPTRASVDAPVPGGILWTKTDLLVVPFRLVNNLTRVLHAG